MANLLENPGFETDTNDPPAKWANFNSPTNVARTSQNSVKYAGNNAWKVNTTDAFNADCGIAQHESSGRTGKIDVSPSTQYYFSNYIKTALSAGQAHTHIKLFEAGYANEAGYDTSDVTGTTDWILNDKTFTTTSTQVICEIWLCFGAYGNPANGTAYFDEMNLDVSGNGRLTMLGVGS